MDSLNITIMMLTSTRMMNYSMFLKFPKANYDPGQGIRIGLWSIPP